MLSKVIKSFVQNTYAHQNSWKECFSHPTLELELNNIEVEMKNSKKHRLMMLETL